MSIIRSSICKSAVFLFCSLALLELDRGEEFPLDKPDLLQQDFPSFKLEYSIILIEGKATFKLKSRGREGTIVFKKGAGFIDNSIVYLPRAEPQQEKIIDNFLQQVKLTCNYSEKTAYKINFKSISTINGFDPQTVVFRPYFVFAPFKYGLLKENSHKIEGSDKIKDRDFEVLSAIIARYPFFDRKCKFWQANDDKFIYKFVIYNEKDEPIFSLDVAELKLNPEIEDKEFSVEIPPDFKEIDITEQFSQQYRILVQLYDLYTLNEELRKNLRVAQAEMQDLSPEINNVVIDRDGMPFPLKPVVKESAILVINRRMNFVIIGLGREENIGVGRVFDVYRADKLLGRLEVSEIYEDMAVAEPVSEGLMGIIREGDKVIAAGREEF